MITIGNERFFAISFEVDRIVYSPEHTWAHGPIVYYLNGERYGNIEDSATLDHCEGWVEGLLHERFTDDDERFIERSKKFKKMTFDEILELFNYLWYDWNNDEIDVSDEFVDLTHEFWLCDVGMIAMSSFDSEWVNMHMIDYSPDMKRMIVAKNQNRNEVRECFVSSKLMYETFRNYLKAYSAEVKYFEKTRPLLTDVNPDGSTDSYR